VIELFLFLCVLAALCGTFAIGGLAVEWWCADE
jgi:hypothetical protein